MLMRKINAGLSLISAVLLLGHAISKTVRMLSQSTIEKSGTFMPWILFGFMLAHAVISIDFAISAYSETEDRKYKSYPKLNAATMVQRISGIVLMLFTALHVAGAAGWCNQKWRYGRYRHRNRRAPLHALNTPARYTPAPDRQRMHNAPASARVQRLHRGHPNTREKPNEAHHDSLNSVPP